MQGDCEGTGKLHANYTLYRAPIAQYILAFNRNIPTIYVCLRPDHVISHNILYTWHPITFYILVYLDINGYDVYSIFEQHSRKRITSQERRSNVTATSWRCSDVVSTLLGRCLFAGTGLDQFEQLSPFYVEETLFQKGWKIIFTVASPWKVICSTWFLHWHGCCWHSIQAPRRCESYV